MELNHVARELVKLQDRVTELEGLVTLILENNLLFIGNDSKAESQHDHNSNLGFDGEGG